MKRLNTIENQKCTKRCRTVEVWNPFDSDNNDERSNAQKMLDIFQLLRSQIMLFIYTFLDEECGIVLDQKCPMLFETLCLLFFPQDLFEKQFGWNPICLGDDKPFHSIQRFWIPFAMCFKNTCGVFKNLFLEGPISVFRHVICKKAIIQMLNHFDNVISHVYHEHHFLKEKPFEAIELDIMKTDCPELSIFRTKINICLNSNVTCILAASTTKVFQRQLSGKFLCDFTESGYIMVCHDFLCDCGTMSHPTVHSFFNDKNVEQQEDEEEFYDDENAEFFD